MISVRGWPLDVEYVPTAQALVAEVAATPRRTGCKPGLGLGMWDQVVPFQCMISAWSAETGCAPTAQALAAEVALTLNRVGVVGLRLGVATWDQAVPFQWTISAANSGLGVLHAAVQYCPTAQALAGEVALTPRSSDMVPGLGLGTRDQAAPFQCKISVCSRAAEV